MQCICVKIGENFLAVLYLSLNIIEIDQRKLGIFPIAKKHGTHDVI